MIAGLDRQGTLREVVRRLRCVESNVEYAVLDGDAEMLLFGATPMLEDCIHAVELVLGEQVAS